MVPSTGALLSMVQYISEDDDGTTAPKPGTTAPKPGATASEPTIDIVSTALAVAKHLQPSHQASNVVSCSAAMIECGTGPKILLRDTPGLALPGRLLNLFASHGARVSHCHLGDLQHKASDFVEQLRRLSPKVTITTDKERREKHAAESRLGYAISLKLHHWAARFRRNKGPKFEVEHKSHITSHVMPHITCPI